MNKTLSITLIVLAIIVLAGGAFFLGSMYARFDAPGLGMMGNFGWNNYSSGPGMMNGRGGYEMGPGMMSGGQGGYGMGPGMMGNYGWYNESRTNVMPLTVDQARQAAEKYIKSLNLQGLETSEIMIFDNNAYVIVKESGTGLGAFELLVDPVSQDAYPEFGPNMMWNLKYGGLNHGSMMGGVGGMMGGGMMGGWNYKDTPPANVSAEMSVAPEQAIEYAQKYLDANSAGATAATDPMKFYGYYTLDFEKDGNIAGMLSVNGYSGQVFLHTWHGNFIEEAK